MLGVNAPEPEKPAAKKPRRKLLPKRKGKKK